MSFEIYEPTENTMIRPILSGECSIAKAGDCTFLPEDLAIVYITDSAAVLIDKGNLRIGFREPPPGDPKAVRVKQCGKRSRISLSGVLRALSLEAAAVKGRYKLTVKEGDKILILNLVVEGDGSS